MKIQIKKIINENENTNVVFFSEFGEAKAFWEGEKPTVNNEYQVEIDIIDTLVWGKEILKTKINKPFIQQENDVTYISGFIDSIDDDGYVVLRLGDYIVPFIATGDAFQIGEYVTLSVKGITLFSVDY